MKVGGWESAILPATSWSMPNSGLRSIGQKDGDMANIAAYIHSLGLKAGIYTDPAKTGAACTLTPAQVPEFGQRGSF